MRRGKEEMKNLMIAVYTDETFEVIGTEKECAEYMNTTVEVLRRARTPKHWEQYEQRKLEGRADTMTVVIVVDEIDE